MMMLSSVLPHRQRGATLVRKVASSRTTMKTLLRSREHHHNTTTIRAVSTTRCLRALPSYSLFLSQQTMIYDHQKYNSIQKRSNFSYAGPRKLDDILKTELLQDKSVTEISDLWMTYHEGKDNVHGIVMEGEKGKSLLAKAAQCPFFIQPVFREEGHFMVVSQFQEPSYFLLAFLEDYKMDPAAAQPLITISVFDDLAEKNDVVLLRCDIINKGIEDDEGYKICQNLIEDYLDGDAVQMFNTKPDAFNIDEFVKEKQVQWDS